MGCGASTAVQTTAVVGEERATDIGTSLHTTVDEATIGADAALDGALTTGGAVTSTSPSAEPSPSQSDQLWVSELASALRAKDMLQPQGDTNSLQGSVANCGISLELLKLVMDAVPKDRTMESVKDGIVELTGPAGRRCRMVELLSSRHVGPPRAFISHRWQCPFRDTAGAVLDHFGYGNLSPSEREEIKVRLLGCPPFRESV